MDAIAQQEQAAFQVTRIHPIGTTWPGRDDIYAGIARGVDGGRDYHVFLAKEEPPRHLSWSAANEWAKTLAGDASLPTRPEQALLYANLKDHFEPDWYWSGTQYAGSGGYAWCQYFYDGSQDSFHKSAELRVRAVRRLPIE